MHDDQHIDRHDDRAATAIRDALPAPDQDAADRIAARIDDGARRSSQARRPRTRRLPVLRPALAGGAVAVAALVALLAPGADDGADSSDLLTSLGPDAAAAEVLHTAGVLAADHGVQALGPGQFLFVTETEHGHADRALRITERWIGTDGTSRTRGLVDPAPIADGDTFYMPAEQCRPAFDPDTPPDINVTETLPVGSTPPACWTKRPGTDEPLLQGATGTVVDAPPAGATVYLPMMLSGDTNGRQLRFGTEVRESDLTSPVPPGFGDAGPAAPTVPGATNEPLADGFQPFLLPTGTTWIEVEARRAVAYDVEDSPGSALPTIVFSHWFNLLDAEAVQDLPADPQEIVDELRGLLAAPDQPGPNSTRDEPVDPELERRSTESMLVFLLSDLLASAPVDPEVRAAMFDALATLRNDGQPATVVRDRTLPDGTDAIGISWPIVPPAGFEGAGDEGDHLLLLIDPATGQLRMREVEVGTRTVSTTWSEPMVVDDTSDVDR